MPTYYRSDNARIQVTVLGVQLDNISWDVADGGDLVADTQNYPPGGMQPAIELGGTPKRSDMTVERIWSDALLKVFKALDAACGDTPGTIGYTVLTKGAGAAVPVDEGSITYTGVLKGVARPGYDSTSTNPAKLVLTFGLNRSIA